MAIVEFMDVSKIYKVGDMEFKALSNASFELNEGELVVILGPSGAGKSTLLNMLGGLDNPTSGKIVVEGNDISKLKNNELAEYRASHVGFVFQFYNLIPTLTVHENVTLVKEIAKDPLSATKMLEEVGLKEHYKKFPSELSGGEQQRVSIARAIVNNPKLLICDEPTGNLDPDTSMEIMRVLEVINELGTTVIVVTHDTAIVNKMKKRVITLDQGRVKEDHEKGTYTKNEKH